MPLPEPNDPGSGPVTFVNRFTLVGSAAEFEAAFAETAEFLCRRPGFRSHSLLVPATDDGAADGSRSYVNIAVWDDEACFRSALAHPEFPAHAKTLRALATSEPALYRARQVRVAPRSAPTEGSGVRET
ncbi:antibiotic biosynthesis monooxygenase family protein [Streptomyces sp. NPDC012389]|uniref:antibiotic biosynthesis monooxygenase family protein n=1 Tax=unclassified Streptomyces TaxID=2593676 RepID=UPI00081E219A|nr:MULTISPECIES: antibiotic biosynthesis monooxygenase [unclassified Streptomyces]MYR96288.1 antibiotic biosynthesis monooxygenase [Streptomyces sp. SID4937]SCE06868.1 monooxygenase [Streptomyces sp. ScaeMP-e83]